MNDVFLKLLLFTAYVFYITRFGTSLILVFIELEPISGNIEKGKTLKIPVFFQLIPSGVLVLLVWAIFSGCSGHSRSYPFSAVCFPVGGLTSPTSRPVPSSNQQPSPSPCSPQTSACQTALEKYTLLLLLTP